MILVNTLILQKCEYPLDIKSKNVVKMAASRSQQENQDSSQASDSDQLQREVFCYQMIVLKNDHDVHLEFDFKVSGF